MDNTIQYFIPIMANALRYFLFAGIPFLLFYYLYPNKFSKNKIQARFAKNKDFIREILHSLQTMGIIAGMGLLIIHSPLSEYTLFYRDLNAYPLWWIPMSIFLALVVHDTYFYWMHRTVHHPSLFKTIHLEHHKSTNPSPWASYSFHFTEGVLESIIAPILLFFIPMHPLALLLFTTASFSMNVYGHLGFEITPKWFRHSFLFEIMNTSTHHNLHHEKFKGNYGLYFRIWDRIMGTEHPDYVKNFDAIQLRRFGTLTPSKSNLNWIPILLIGFMGLLSLSSMTSPTASNSILGKWDTQEGAIIEIYKENGKYFGKVVKFTIKEYEEKRKKTGRTLYIIKDFVKKNATEYCCGTLYAPRYQKTITPDRVSLKLKDKNMLVLKGYYMGFSKTKKWVRV